MASLAEMPIGPLQIERIPGSARIRFTFGGKTYDGGYGYTELHPSGNGITVDLIGVDVGYRPDPGIINELCSDEMIRYYRSPWRRLVFRLPKPGPGEIPTRWERAELIEWERLKDE